MVSPSSDLHEPPTGLRQSGWRLGRLVSSKSLPTKPRIQRRIPRFTYAHLVADEEIA